MSDVVDTFESDGSFDEVSSTSIQNQPQSDVRLEYVASSFKSKIDCQLITGIDAGLSGDVAITVDLEVCIAEDDQGIPGPVICSGKATVGMTESPRHLNFNVGPTKHSMVAGKVYWIYIKAVTPNSSLGWFFSKKAELHKICFYNDGWGKPIDSRQYAFRITGTP